MLIILLLKVVDYLSYTSLSKNTMLKYLRSKTAFYLLIISLIIIYGFSDIITSPENFVFGESLQFWHYGNLAVKKSLTVYGQLGLWDNQHGLGYSLISHLTSLFYPFSWSSFLISKDLFSIKFNEVLHLVMAGAACFYLLRTVSISKVSSAIGALVFLFDDYIYQTVINGYFSEIYNLVWMPLSIAFLWKALFERNLKYSIFAGFSLSMQILAMSLYSVFINFILILFLLSYYFLYVFIKLRKELLKNILYLILVSVILFSIAVGISAVKLLPVLEYKELS